MDQQFDKSNQADQQDQARQPQQQPPQYNPQYQHEYNAADLSKPMTVGQYMLVYLIGAIPVAGIIMMFVWAFGSNTNINKKNWARAMLLWALIILVLYIIIFAIFGAAFFNSLGNMGGSGY